MNEIAQKGFDENSSRNYLGGDFSPQINWTDNLKVIIGRSEGRNEILESPLTITDNAGQNSSRATEARAAEEKPAVDRCSYNRYYNPIKDAVNTVNANTLDLLGRNVYYSPPLPGYHRPYIPGFNPPTVAYPPIIPPAFLNRGYGVPSIPGVLVGPAGGHHGGHGGHGHRGHGHG
jgi:hypothetical protein